ncbi:MAG: GDP-mannose 4,6-dehydratase [Magnetococcus sp. WYHC-3]
MKGTLLLIGGLGFVGKHVRALAGPDLTCVVTDMDVDIRDAEAVASLIDATRPDWVINLAAITTLKESFDSQKSTYDINFMGVLNILSGLKASGFKGRYLQVGSSQVYGCPKAEALPITEEHPCEMLNPYSVSKAAAELLCCQWQRSEGLETLMARPFNHIGPGQSDRFAVARFAKEIVDIKRGLKEPLLRVGNLAPTRDFTDVRDVARAYLAILEHGTSGEIYNVCSGREVAMSRIVEMLAELAGVDVAVDIDPCLFREADLLRVLGSHDKLTEKTGWRPTIPLEQSLLDILADWERGVVGS